MMIFPGFADFEIINYFSKLTNKITKNHICLFAININF